MRIGRLEERRSSPPPAGYVGGKKIRALLPVEGEWFCLQIAYASPESPRLFLSRLMPWALAEQPDGVDHVIGIDATGVPYEDPFTEIHYLCGTDVAPNGSPWSQVYCSTQPSFHPVREVTHLFAGQA